MDWIRSVCVCGSARAAAACRYCSRVSGFAKRNNKGGPNCRVGGPVWKIPNTPAPLGISPLRIWKRESVKSVRAHVNLHDLDILSATFSFREQVVIPGIPRTSANAMLMLCYGIASASGMRMREMALALAYGGARRVAVRWREHSLNHSA